MAIMLEVPVYDIDGKQVETLEVDENDFGGFVNEDLLKQAESVAPTRRSRRVE